MLYGNNWCWLTGPEKVAMINNHWEKKNCIGNISLAQHREASVWIGQDCISSWYRTWKYVGGAQVIVVLKEFERIMEISWVLAPWVKVEVPKESQGEPTVENEVANVVKLQDGSRYCKTIWGKTPCCLVSIAEGQLGEELVKAEHE